MRACGRFSCSEQIDCCAAARAGAKRFGARGGSRTHSSAATEMKFSLAAPFLVPDAEDECVIVHHLEVDCKQMASLIAGSTHKQNAHITGMAGTISSLEIK